MKDGSDAIADWAILNAMLNVAGGASWVSFHHGGGVGIGNSLHAGQVIVADGSDRMRRRLERVLTNDPGIGVARHADAGYDIAIATAEREGVRLPMRELQQRTDRIVTIGADAIESLSAVARADLSRQVLLAARTTTSSAAQLRGHDALQRPLRLL
jgi:hypothetical protein